MRQQRVVLRGPNCVDMLEYCTQPMIVVDAIGVACREGAAKSWLHGDILGDDMGICQEPVPASDCDGPKPALAFSIRLLSISRCPLYR